MPTLTMTVGGRAISLGLGLLVSALALGMAWRSYRDAFCASSDQEETRSRLGPMVTCTGGLACAPEDVTRIQARFGGTQPGSYEVVGE